MSNPLQIRAQLEAAINWSAPIEAPTIAKYKGSCAIATAYVEKLREYCAYCVAQQNQAYEEYCLLHSQNDAIYKVQYEVVEQWTKRAWELDNMVTTFLDAYDAAPLQDVVEVVRVSCLHPRMQWRLYGVVIMVAALLLVAHFVGGF